MGKKFNMVLKTLDNRRDVLIDEICRLEDTVFPQPPTEEERDILDSRIHDLEISLKEVNFIINAINEPAWGFGFYNLRYDNNIVYEKMHEEHLRNNKDGE